MAKPDFTRQKGFEQILSEVLPPIDWDVEPLIARAERVVIYGEFDSMKSWIMLELGRCFATGTPFLGLYEVKPRSVLYLDEEMASRTAQSRLQRLNKGADSPKTIARFDLASRTGFQANSLGITTLAEHLGHLDWAPDVLIIETLRRVLPGEEVSQQDISRFWYNMTALAQERMTVIVSHHMRKPQREGEDSSRDRASGSTDILAGADAAYAVERVKTGHVKLECVKIREAEPPPPCAIILDGPPGPTSPLRLVGMPLNAAQGRDMVIKALIATQPNHCVSSSVLERLGAEMGISRTSLYRYLTLLKDTGQILQPTHGIWMIPPVA